MNIRGRVARGRVATLKSFLLALAIVVVALAALALGVAMVAEWALDIHARVTTPPGLSVQAAYDAFLAERVHPLYFFFFPTDVSELKRRNNPIVSITPSGFRGDTPEARGTRRLAFLTGGSTTFGWGVPTPETTITGWLNRLEPSTLFVNAGVPGWNSTQEFYRLSMELVNYRPELVISFSGINDAGISSNYYLRGKHYPKGTPRYFDSGEKRVEAHGWTHLALLKKELSEELFPRLQQQMHQMFPKRARGKKNDKGLKPAGREDAAQAADRYVKTLALMRGVANGAGARFVAILQPSALMCRNIARPPDAGNLPRARIEYIQEFYRRVLERVDGEVELWDMSCIFDRYVEEAKKSPLFAIDPSAAHFTPEGNRIVAEEIRSRLRRTTKP